MEVNGFENRAVRAHPFLYFELYDVGSGIALVDELMASYEAEWLPWLGFDLFEDLTSVSFCARVADDFTLTTEHLVVLQGDIDADADLRYARANGGRRAPSCCWS